MIVSQCVICRNGIRRWYFRVIRVIMIMTVMNFGSLFLKIGE